MKTILSSLLFALIGFLPLTVFAQTTPEAYLGQLPAIPNVACAADTSVVNNFTNRIFTVKAALQETIDQIHNSTQNQEEQIKNQALSSASKQLGLSKNDMEQLQQENTEEAQARKIAEKSISKQTGFSLQELEHIGEMSEAEQEKWAQNYASQQMRQTSQQSKTTSRNQGNSSRLFELSKEQQSIGERITAKMNRIAKIFKEVEQQDTIETRKLNAKLPALESQLCSGICSPAEVARSKAAEKQIYNLRLQYCQKMSPLQINAISQYLTSIKSLFPDYRRLAEVQNEIARLQFGTFVPVDLSCYSAVDEYASVLEESYKYWTGKFEQ